MPSAAAGEVTVTELQQSIFNAPPSSTNTTSTLPPPPILKPPPVADLAMEDARSPTTSVLVKRGEEMRKKRRMKTVRVMLLWKRIATMSKRDGSQALQGVWSELENLRPF